MRKVTVAVLDASGMLTDFQKIDKDSVTKDSVVVPDNCDLKPNRYRWNGETFLPVLPTAAENIKSDPDALKIIARALIALRDGKKFPSDVLDWLANFETSLDNQG